VATTCPTEAVPSQARTMSNPSASLLQAGSNRQFSILVIIFSPFFVFDALILLYKLFY